jgi:hypothetical protein
MTSRRRLLLIALPLALVFALWAGPGLSPDDGELVPPVPPEVTVPPDPPAPEAPPVPECEPPRDPGPDGDG